jgi:hypothetical protein
MSETEINRLSRRLANITLSNHLAKRNIKKIIEKLIDKIDRGDKGTFTLSMSLLDIKSWADKLIVDKTIKYPKSNKNDIFVKHIENHLKEMGLEKVVCKICGKDIDTIYKEQP